MQQFVVELEGRITVEPDAGGSVRRAVIEAHLDEVMSELLLLEDAEDPSIEADFGRCTFSIAVMVSSVNPIEAVSKAVGLIRTAVHAAGGATPDWPSVDETWAMSLVRVSSEMVSEVVDSDNDVLPELASA